jgi:poly(3-hydroxybutyrate) depolymerase
LLGLDSYLHSRWQILMGNSIVQVNLQPGSKRSCILWNPSGKPQEPMVVVVLHM